MKLKLLSVGSDAKTVKGLKVGVMTGIMYLAPSDESGVINTCLCASKGCRASCLFTAGRGAYSNVKKARIAKTGLFYKNTTMFLDALDANITLLEKKAKKAGKIPAVRLNGTSDINWEVYQLYCPHTEPDCNYSFNLFELHTDVKFYDYTKDIQRVREYAKGKFPSNYHLTFSKSESNDKEVAEAISLGVNVAVVFTKLPNTYMGRPVIDGDLHDARFLDGENVIVGLKAKGKARKDTTGFVVKV